MEPKRFHISITATGIFCIFFCIFSIINVIKGDMLYFVLGIVCIYHIINCFVSISNPSKVKISDDEISFSAYGKTHTYKKDGIENIQIKELSKYRKMYVRINDVKLLKGRYWINCDKMNDGKQLWDLLIYFEYKKNPNQLKFQAYTPKNPYVAEETTDSENQKTLEENPTISDMEITNNNI